MRVQLFSWIYKTDGKTISLTGDMVYGAPPLESNLNFDPGDLSKHGIFETYFKEFSFKFDPNKTAQVYNSQESAGQGPTPYTSGTKMYYAGFSVDTSLLVPGYSIHFDLYNEKVRCGDVDVNKFAPFSHDANSTTNVPEPSTALLLGFGLIGLAGVGRKMKRQTKPLAAAFITDRRGQRWPRLLPSCN